MRPSLRLLITLIVVAIAVCAGLWLWNYYLFTPWTRDARVRAEIVTVAPDVSGWVRSLHVNDTGFVERGAPLFEIDPSHYQAALDKAEATVSDRQATLELRRAEAKRRSRLSDRSISAEDRQIAEINSKIAAADLAQARADLKSARLNLARTKVTAPVSGHVLNLQLAAGNYVTRGTPVMALVRSNSYYVMGYFEETKMASIRVGSPAEVILMNGNTHLRGHVAGIGRGIADSNTNLNNQLLPQVQPTFNWVRLAQRIPVRIALDNVPEGTLLSAGMTATVHIQARAGSRQTPPARAPAVGPDADRRPAEAASPGDTGADSR